jgi:hypothetical protein
MFVVFFVEHVTGRLSERCLRRGLAFGCLCGLDRLTFALAPVVFISVEQ